jgi:hypothetical protein
MGMQAVPKHSSVSFGSAGALWGLWIDHDPTCRKEGGCRMQMIFEFIDQFEAFDWFFLAIALSLAILYIQSLIRKHDDRRKKKGYYVKPQRRSDFLAELYTRKDKFL